MKYFRRNEYGEEIKIEMYFDGHNIPLSASYVSKRRKKLLKFLHEQMIGERCPILMLLSEKTKLKFRSRKAKTMWNWLTNAYSFSKNQSGVECDELDKDLSYLEKRNFIKMHKEIKNIETTVNHFRSFNTNHSCELTRDGELEVRNWFSKMYEKQPATTAQVLWTGGNLIWTICLTYNIVQKIIQAGQSAWNYIFP